jgi:diadenylate cyclase
MDELFDLIDGVQVEPIALLDIFLTSVLIYGLFSVIQGTRAVRLVIGAAILYLLYSLTQALDLRLLTGIMETGAVVALLALVVIFQPELRRGLDRLGRFGTLGLALVPTQAASAQRVARVLARAASRLAAQRIGALIVVERETGLEDMAESGVMLHADLSEELLATIFAPHAALHDGAVIVRGERIVAAGATLPLAVTSVQHERLGTRHRAAIGMTEQTDAIAIVVSEESGSVSLVERGVVRRHLDEERLRRALAGLLHLGGGGTRGMAVLGGRRLRGKRARGTPAVRGRGSPDATVRSE